MGILLICHEADEGVVARQVLRLARCLIERSHRVVVVGPRGSWLVRRCGAAGIVSHDVPMQGRADLRSYLRVLTIARRSRIDLLHGHDGRSALYAAVVARLTGRRAVATVHVPTARGAWALAHRTIAANKALRSHLLGGRMLAREIDVIYEGVPDPTPRASERRHAVRESLGLAPADVAIGTIGPLDPRRGHGLLIDAVARLRRVHRRVHLCVIGRAAGERSGALVRRAAEAGLAGHLHFVDRPRALSSRLAAMDILALPDHRPRASLSAIEALAVGLPVVASISEGVNEIVPHGETGLLFARGDGSMLTLMLTLLVEDRAWRARLGANARRLYLESFTLQRMAAETETIYEILGNRRQSP